jgi:hypothetical protein
MNTMVTNRIVENYFRIINSWDSVAKNQLIHKLKEKVESNSNDKSDFSLCFGSWDDNRSADEIINELINDRINHLEIEEL